MEQEFSQEKLRDFFNRKVAQYNQPSFIKDDPICIPHQFTKKQDIEIAAFFANEHWTRAFDADAGVTAHLRAGARKSICHVNITYVM